MKLKYCEILNKNCHINSHSLSSMLSNSNRQHEWHTDKSTNRCRERQIRNVQGYTFSGNQAWLTVFKCFSSEVSVTHVNRLIDEERVKSDKTCVNSGASTC